jgi:hypothetical protein
VIRFAASSDEVSDFRERYGDDISSYDQALQFGLGTNDLRKQPLRNDTLSPALLNPNLIPASEYVHWRLDEMPYLQDQADYPLYAIAGTNFPTTDTIDYFAHDNHLTHVNTKGDDGDGTVPTRSALFGTGDSYLFDIGAFNKDSGTNLSHATLLEARPVRDLVSQIIKKAPAITRYIRNAVSDKDESVLYRFGTHSPVTLELFDGSGRRTGKVEGNASTTDLSFVQADIPNSTYEEVGDETYINLLNPKGTYRFRVNGIRSGRFTFDVRRSGRALIQFSDVEVREGSRGEVAFDPEKPDSAILGMDNDGDGIVDETVRPDDYASAASPQGSSSKPRRPEKIFARPPDPCCLD